MGDRGLMKWNGFFMPEQKELIKQAYIESLKTAKPILDEGQLHEMNDLLIKSMQDYEPIKLTLWMDGFIKDFGPVIVHKIDPYQRHLYVLYKNGKQTFHFNSLIGVIKQ
ncbi:YolD-like family protein [Niallia endozanthoxylica]|uniref:YolD-like family protein n=1 Tax=Niallia endozanthoxylica TaxID=2036016 RepID=A0A5J5GWB3_9BACI|nr:YolD-like family protein [Niallia endozanthoxylica]KAA9012287.1 YolD-like family protein [Niallia endozanthoxylica]